MEPTDKNRPFDFWNDHSLEFLEMAIKRVWHGWTTKENAEEYQSILQNEVIPGVEAKGISGLRKFEILRIELDDEVEFVTIITFDSIQDVIAFQGKDYQKAYVPDAARKVLQRWDEEIPHYELIETRIY